MKKILLLLALVSLCLIGCRKESPEYTRGKEDGFEIGYDIGYDDGYYDGYDDALKKGVK